MPTEDAPTEEQTEALTAEVDDMQPIVLSASSWYLWRRVVAFTVLPLFFSLYFFYDWKYGYPKKREQWEVYQQWKKEERSTTDWVRYASEQGWDKEPDEMTDEKIQEQFNWGVGTGVVGLALLAYYLLSYPKKLRADATSLTPPWSPPVPFDKVRRVDRRPWKLKGLAYAYWQPDGAPADKLKKAEIDDLRFPGADKILTRLTRNFDGEILDLIEDPEPTLADATEDSGSDEATEPKVADTASTAPPPPKS